MGSSVEQATDLKRASPAHLWRASQLQWPGLYGGIGPVGIIDRMATDGYFVRGPTSNTGGIGIDIETGRQRCNTLG
jgi:hypothetical protein